MSEGAGRPRRWWIALLLNLVFPPTGYAYLGAWDAVGVSVAAVLVGAVAIDELTLLRPPGVYILGPDGILLAAVGIMVLFGLHAAWLARRAPPRLTRLRPLLYLAPWLGLFLANGLLTALWPYPAYVVSSASMQPTLRADDVIIARGARALCGHVAVKPGDVVIYGGGERPQLHRAIAGPGQTVAMQDGRLILDGDAVARRALPSTTGGPAQFEETLPNGVSFRTYDSGPIGASDQIDPTTIPPGSWYVLGDNRDRSADSRVNGPVSEGDICAIGFKIATNKDKRRVGQKP